MTTLRDQRAVERAVEVAREAGYTVAGARVIRSCGAVIVELPAAEVVVRVEIPEREYVSWCMTKTARYLERCGAPTLRLLHAAPPVTIWPRLEPSAEVDMGELGRLVREVHACTRSPSDTTLPRLRPFVEITGLLDMLERGGDWPREDLEALRELEAELEASWREIAERDPLGIALVHGDVHWDNVMIAASGPVLIDLELAGVGPVTWDFVQFGLGVRRYGHDPAHHEAFIAGYGADPRGWPGYAVMLGCYELLCAVWAAAFRDRGPGFAREARLRIDGVLGRGDATWTLL